MAQGHRETSLIIALKDCQLNVLAEKVAAANNIPLHHPQPLAPEVPSRQLPAEVQPDGPLPIPSELQDDTISCDDMPTPTPTFDSEPVPVMIRCRGILGCRTLTLAFFCILLPVMLAAIANKYLL